MPALLTRTSRPPRRSIAVSNRAFTAERSATSHHDDEMPGSVVASSASASLSTSQTWTWPPPRRRPARPRGRCRGARCHQHTQPADAQIHGPSSPYALLRAAARPPRPDDEVRGAADVAATMAVRAAAPSRARIAASASAWNRMAPLRARRSGLAPRSRLSTGPAFSQSAPMISTGSAGRPPRRSRNAGSC